MTDIVERLVERLLKRVEVAECDSRFGDAEDMRDAADWIKRLRLYVKDLQTNGQPQAALDEIERLRSVRDECERQYQEQVAKVGKLLTENERLEAVAKILEDENERLRDESLGLRIDVEAYRTAKWRDNSDMEQMRAEIERLRMLAAIKLAEGK